MRRILPARRPSETVETEWQGHAIAVTVGFWPGTWEPGEVFANVPAGGTIQATLADACVLVSIALQHGVTPEALAKSLAREPAWVGGVETTAAASPVGAVLEAVVRLCRGEDDGAQVAPPRPSPVTPGVTA